MNRDLYAKLSWLPEPPPDFRQRCREVDDSSDAGRAISRLAGHALHENQLRWLAAAIERLREKGHSLAPLTPFTLGVIGNGSLEPLVPSLVGSAARHGIALRCVTADFGQIAQAALASASRINRSSPDAILLALDYRALPLTRGFHDRRAGADAVVDGAITYIQALRDAINRISNSVGIVQTIASPPETNFGSLDRAVPGTLRNLIATFNASLTDSVAASSDILFDVAALAETVGCANWHSPTQWNMAKFPFNTVFLPLYADHVCRLIGARLGKSRRCLVLDLDNTVWGGVLGDDGLEGIVIGQGDATGEAYLDVQRAVLELRDRGIVLAVSSKNDDDVARAAFTSHPEMLIRQNHIAVFQANWDDKATNIAAVAAELRFGLDAMVFLDDNPAERSLVRERLPEVAVPELPDDPALYARTLSAAGYFESVKFSEEDRRRAGFYEDNARRVAIQHTGVIGDVESYLASLKMTIVFRPFDSMGRTRIAQLVNKSNQFNLTTRRYSERDVAALQADRNCFTMQVRLVDTFGDNGMISVVICRRGPDSEWVIDTWLMSCRVLGRRVEQMVLREIIHHARACAIRRLIGKYDPTPRNRMVEHHYQTLGFDLVERCSDGSTIWSLETDFEVEAPPMAIDRGGFEPSAG